MNKLCSEFSRHQVIELIRKAIIYREQQDCPPMTIGRFKNRFCLPEVGAHNQYLLRLFAGYPNTYHVVLVAGMYIAVRPPHTLIPILISYPPDS